jgi:hypothetical protein
MGYQNIQIAESEEIIVKDESIAKVKWNKNIVKNGTVFDGVNGEEFNIKLSGKNVMYEFIITVKWTCRMSGIRTISLEDPNQRIYNSTFIPDNIDGDIEESHKQQVIFKILVTKSGGWKLRLYQHSGEELKAKVDMKVIGPFIY